MVCKQVVGQDARQRGSVEVAGKLSTSRVRKGPPRFQVALLD